MRLTGPVPGRSGRLLATGFGYDPARRALQVRALAALLPAFGDVRRIGSAALDLCMVADGTLDATPSSARRSTTGPPARWWRRRPASR